MKKTLLILSVAVALVGLATWLGTGANRGWTKTSVMVKSLDPVTGIEGITYQPKFSPGVDFLGATGLLAAAFAIGSLFFSKSSKNKTTNQT